MPTQSTRPAALLLAAVLAHAGAQSVTQGDLRYAAPTCQALGMGAVDCSLTVTSAKTSSVIVDPRNTRAYGPDGQTYRPTSATSDGQEIRDTFFNVPVPAGVPVKVVYHFTGLPGTLTAFKGVTFNNVAFQNLKFGGVAPGAAALPTPTGVPTGFALTLSQCVPQGASYTCTATLTPTR